MHGEGGGGEGVGVEGDTDRACGGEAGDAFERVFGVDEDGGVLVRGRLVGSL